MKIIIRNLLVLLILITNVGYSQFNFKLSYNGYFDDNLYRSPNSVQDYLSSIKLGLNYNFEKEKILLYNNFDILRYQENADRNFVTNNIGLTKHIKLGENQFSNLYIGGNWNLRVNKNDYEYYNFSQLSGYINLQFFTNLFLMKGGYNYRWREYQNWNELSNHLHNVFFQINKSFPTRTTLIIETGLGNKSFLGQDSITNTTNMGHGNGRNSNAAITTEAIEKALNTSQFNFTFRVSQSLTDKIGLYAQYRKQISIDDETNYRNFNDYYQDDELFDDPFTYESDSYYSQLTIMLPKLTKIAIGGSFFDKQYISENTYSDENDSVGTDELRVDEQSKFYVDLSKTINMNKNWITSIKFNLYLSYTNNLSNSYLYNYENSAIGAGIQLRF